MVADESKERLEVLKISERLEFEELRGDKDIKYWIRYNRKFGHMHLVNPTHRQSYRQLYDLDIKAVILVMICVPTYFLLKCMANFCQFKWKSKSGREQHTETET